MTILTAPIAALPAAFRPITVAEFNTLAGLGTFEDDVTVELVGGVMIEMSPISEEHAWLVTQLNTRLARECGPDHVISPQNLLVTDEISQPQPDLAVLPVEELGDGTWGSVAAQAEGTVVAVAVPTVTIDVGWVFNS